MRIINALKQRHAMILVQAIRPSYRSRKVPSGSVERLKFMVPVRRTWEQEKWRRQMIQQVPLEAIVVDAAKHQV